VHVLGEDASSPNELVQLAERALPVFEELRDDRSLGRTWLLRGWVKGGLLGRCTEWEESAERALGHYRRLGLPSSTCIAQIAAAEYHGPVPVENAIEHVSDLLARVDDLPGEATLLAYLGGLESMRGKAAESSELLSRGRSLFVELGRPTGLVRTCAPLEAEGARLVGDYERAAETLLESCRILRESRSWSHFATQSASLAEAFRELGRIDDALTWVAAAQNHAVPDDMWAQIAWRSVRARIDGSEQLAREAVELARSTELVCQHAFALISVGDEHSRAAALRLYEEKGNVAAVSHATAATL
jgi:tetratricopeptide (TPR) repeat protein